MHTVSGQQERYDLIIIGAGISGIGVAQLARAHGKKYLLLEKGNALADCSQASMRIIHGGFRYLQHLDIARVLESLKAKTKLLRDYPDCIEEFPCVFALEGSGLKSSSPMRAASCLYRLLAAATNTNAGRQAILEAQEAGKREELGHAPFGAFLWTDARITKRDIFFAKLLEEHRENLSEQTQATRVSKTQSGFVVHAQQAGQEISLHCSCVVNCSGAGLWDISCEGMKTKERPKLLWSKGHNLTLRYAKPLSCGVARPSSAGNMLFLSQREKGIACIGTWYAPPQKKALERSVSEQEVQESLQDFQSAFPNIQLGLEDVLSQEVGYIPALGMKGKQVQVLHREQIIDHGGYIEVISTKLTTFQMQAQRVWKYVQRSFERCTRSGG